MASDAEFSEISSLFDRFLGNSLLLPFIVEFSPETEEDDDDQRDPEPLAEGIIFINPLTQRMVVIGNPSSSDLDSLFQGIGAKSGQPPASKASIEAMPAVEVREGAEDGDCVICLENWVCGDLVKEMPCKHKFHGGCVEKWLKIHGSCPVCRFEMPVEGKKKKKKNGDGSGEIWVSVGINGDDDRSSDDSDS